MKVRIGYPLYNKKVSDTEAHETMKTLFVAGLMGIIFAVLYLIAAADYAQVNHF